MIKEFKNTSRAFFNRLNEPQVMEKIVSCLIFTLELEQKGLKVPVFFPCDKIWV